jgi:S-formylglutathione hydrolase FrmB
LPLLAKRGLRVDRVAVLGYSMGGYGALLLAETLGRQRVAATAASFPAVFRSYADARRTNPRSFDSPADFAAHDVVTRLGALDSRTTWVDCGHSDPFAPTAQLIRTRLREPAGGLYDGCHDAAFWRSRLPAQLDFLGRHLAG